MSLDYDVAIIGGGPSGCACALALQGKGLKVALIDKDVFPRDKICGDAIPGPSFKAINSLNKDWGERMKSFVEKMLITSSSLSIGTDKNITYEWLSYAYNSKRIDFDNFLFQLVKKETDAIILENKRVQKVTVDENFTVCIFQDGTSITASILVGADGANSIVKRQLTDTHSSDTNAFAAIRAYYKGIEGIRAGDNEFHLLDGLSGYFWIFPLRNGWANVGFGVYKKREKSNKPPNDLRSTMEQITNSPTFKDRFKNAELVGNINGFGLPLWTGKRQVSGKRFILCGDAASLIDPLQGHGIDKALWSGIIAAQQIVSCIKNNNFSADFISQYDIMLFQKFGRELRRNYILMRLMFRFQYFNKIIFKLASHQKISNWLIRKLKI